MQDLTSISSFEKILLRISFCTSKKNTLYQQVLTIQSLLLDLYFVVFQKALKYIVGALQLLLSRLTSLRLHHLYDSVARDIRHCDVIKTVIPAGTLLLDDVICGKGAIVLSCTLPDTPVGVTCRGQDIKEEVTGNSLTGTVLSHIMPKLDLYYSNGFS